MIFAHVPARLRTISALRSLSELEARFHGGVLLPVSEGYAAAIMSGIEDQLLKEGYFYFVASHRG